MALVLGGPISRVTRDVRHCRTKHGEAELFLAFRDGRVVGRISAQVDRHFNDYHDNRWGMFGFLEFEEDVEVLGALLDAAGRWLRDHGRDRMVGPMDFTMNDESGVLIDVRPRRPSRPRVAPPVRRGL